MSVKTTSYVDIKSINDEETKVGDDFKLQIDSHWIYNDKINILFPRELSKNGEKVYLTINAEDLIKAINRCSG